MKGRSAIILNIILLAMLVALPWACKSEFVESPVGSETICDTIDDITVITANASESARGRGKVAVFGTNSQPIANATVNVRHSGQTTALLDPVTGTAITGNGVTEFISQTNDQGFLQIDILCTAPTGSSVTCGAVFDIGVDSCPSQFTLTVEAASVATPTPTPTP